MRKVIKKETKKVTKQEAISTNDAVLIHYITVVVVLLSILILCFNEMSAFDELRRSRTLPKETTIKNVIPEVKGEEEEELDYDEVPNIEVDYNKYELVKGIVRLFPKKNDSKVKGDNVYKKFNLKTAERHREKIVSYYKDYKIVYNYIDGGVDSSKITVYNKKTNKVLYTNNHIKTVIIGENDKFYNTLPTISGGKLHILMYNPKHCYVDEYADYSPFIEYVTINLSGNKLKEKTVLTVSGIGYGEVPNCR